MDVKRIVSGLRDDVGMTLLELVIASLILFIAVTAVFGLIITSTSMSVLAKQQNTATNSAASYMEYVRTLPYPSVGVAGSSIPGSLSVETSMKVEGIDVVISPTVTWVNDAAIEGTRDYKRLDVRVRTSVPNSTRTTTQVFTTYVRETDPNASSGAAVGPPTLQWVAGSSPVPLSTVFSGTNERISVRAQTAAASVNLQRVTISVDSTKVAGTGITPSPATSGFAEWTGIGAPGPLDFTVNWTSSTANDGYRALTAFCEDAAGGSTSKTLQVIVDNVAPSAVATITGASDTSRTARAQWAGAMDGSDPAPTYRLGVRVQGNGGDDVWSDLAGTPITVNALYADHACVAFSRYRPNVTALSIRGLVGATTDGTAPYISKSNLTGESTSTYQSSPSKRWATTARLTLGAPTFRYYTITNYYYQADAATGPWTTPLNAAGTADLFYNVPAYYNATQNSSKTGDIGLKYYRVRSVIQPKGYPSYATNASAEVWSAVMRNQQVAGRASLVFVQW